MSMSDIGVVLFVVFWNPVMIVMIDVHASHGIPPNRPTESKTKVEGLDPSSTMFNYPSWVPQVS